MSSQSTAARDAESSRGFVAPPSIRVENLRKRGLDSVRISLQQRALWLNPMRDGAVLLCVIAGVALKPSFASLLLGLLILAAHGAFLHRKRQLMEDWEIRISPDLVTIVAVAGSDAEQQSWQLHFADIERISLGRRRSGATLDITTPDAIIQLGRGQPIEALAWLENYLVMELAGLTWRPLHGVDRRHSRSREMLSTNPLLLKPDLAERLIKIFARQAPELVRQIGVALAANDTDAASRHAHSLKSASASVGAHRVSELCQLMETHAREGDHDRMAVLAREIEQRCGEVIARLKDIGDAAAGEIARMTLRGDGGEPDTGATSAGSQRDEDSTAPATTSAVAASALHQAKVLVVDDSEISREIAKAFLEDVVTEVAFARDGIEAFNLMCNQRFDVVLMDCEMQGFDGYMCTRRWRRQETISGASRIPIIATTAHALKGDRGRCIAAGMDDYLAKPYTPESLRGRIEHWLLEWPKQLAAEQAARDAELARTAEAGEAEPVEPRAAMA